MRHACSMKEVPRLGASAMAPALPFENFGAVFWSRGPYGCDKDVPPRHAGLNCIERPAQRVRSLRPRKRKSVLFVIWATTKIIFEHLPGR